MQFALQDLRKWGYKKIFQSFASNEQERVNFFQDIEKADYAYYNVKCSAFTFPRKWGSIKEECSHYYLGMKTFIYSCEPMIDNIEIDNTCQRKFRNQWYSLWRSVTKDLDLTERESKLLENFGIKLAFADLEQYEVPDNIITFFDAVLGWYVFTQSEYSFDTVDMTPLELVELLVTSDSDSFVGIVRTSFS